MHASREGDRGAGPHLENHNAIGFLSNTGPKSLKNRKATKTAFNVGPSLARPLAKLFGSAHDVVHHLMFIFLQLYPRLNKGILMLYQSPSVRPSSFLSLHLLNCWDIATLKLCRCRGYWPMFCVTWTQRSRLNNIFSCKCIS